MTRAKAIQAYCFECAGDSHKEVTLCVLKDCPLYPYRFGNSPKSKGYKERMKLAKTRWPDDWASTIAILDAK
jgi:hypothetical protein